MAGPALRVEEAAGSGWDARVRRFRAGDEVDTFAVVTERFVALVDTMSTPEQAAHLLERVRRLLSGRLLLVVNTHADWDHAWGNAVFAAPGGIAPAPIIAHELAAGRLRGEIERATLARKRAEEMRFASVALVPPTITFRDGLRLDGGDLTLELVPTPGHTPDHVAVWIPAIRTLLAGDAAEQPWPCVPNGAGLVEMRASLERMRALRPAVVLPCHGGTSGPGLLDRNLAYLDALEAHVRRAVEDGRLSTGGEAGGSGGSGALPDDDLPDRVGFDWRAAAALVGAEPAQVADLYRRFHAGAVAAAVELARMPSRAT